MNEYLIIDCFGNTYTANATDILSAINQILSSDINQVDTIVQVTQLSQ